ncbi:MAG: hypothetical protein ACSHWZ_19335, partial [Sulfitobacter sp.]
MYDPLKHLAIQSNALQLWSKKWSKVGDPILVLSPLSLVLLEYYPILRRICGGQTGIRTLETVSRLHTFQACAFDH